jgi:hypothetical protein
MSGKSYQLHVGLRNLHVTLEVLLVKAPPFYQGMTRPRFADEKVGPDRWINYRCSGGRIADGSQLSCLKSECRVQKAVHLTRTKLDADESTWGGEPEVS